MSDPGLSPEEYLKQLNDAAQRHDRGESASRVAPATADPTRPVTGTSSPGRRPIGGRVVGLVALGVLVAVGLVLFQSFTDAGPDEITSIDQAEGVEAERGREAIDLLESVEVPASWTEIVAQDLSIREMSDDRVRADVDQTWQTPADYTPADLRQWFSALPYVRERLDSADCTETLDGSDASCSVSAYPVDADGNTDYDAPRQSLRVTFTTYGDLPEARLSADSSG